VSARGFRCGSNTAPQFEQRTFVLLNRRTSDGCISWPHWGQRVVSDAFTFARSTFRLGGKREESSMNEKPGRQLSLGTHRPASILGQLPHKASP